MARVLVTGGLGFVGTHIVRHLESLGHEVSVVDAAVRQAPGYVRADVTSHVEMERAFDKSRPEFVLHLAAEYGREHGELYIRRSVETNVVGTINVCQVCVGHKARLVLASTSEVYGDVGARTMAEELGYGQPSNVYGISKMQAEQYVRHYAENYGLDAHIVRMFMCYGPGEYPSAFRSAISRFTYNALHRKPVTVHRGTSRSWCYIDDIAAGWASVIGGFKSGKLETYNIGRHDPVPMEKVARLIFELAGAPETLIGFSEAPKLVTPVKNASFERAAALLGFRARTRLEDGLRRTVEWQRENVKDPNIEC